MHGHLSHPPASRLNVSLRFQKGKGALNQLRSMSLCLICFLSNFSTSCSSRSACFSVGSPEKSRAPGYTPSPTTSGTGLGGELGWRGGQEQACAALLAMTQDQSLSLSLPSVKWESQMWQSPGKLWTVQALRSWGWSYWWVDRKATLLAVLTWVL